VGVFVCRRGSYQLFVKTKNQMSALHSLIVGSLIGEGEISLKPNSAMVDCNLNRSKITFIHNYIAENELASFVEVNIKKMQLTIYDENSIKTYLKNWYKNGRKIYYNADVNYEAVMISFILFGKRKIENLILETTIDQKYLPTMARSIESHLNTPILSGNKEVKVFDASSIFLGAWKRLGLIECTEIANYLTNKEKRAITDNIEKMSHGGNFHEIS
jgi:hypothetical protein